MGETLTARVKSTLQTTSGTAYLWLQQCNANKSPIGPVTASGSAVYTQSVTGESIKGWDVPHFHARQKKGELLPQTPFEKYSQSGRCSTVYDLYYIHAGVGWDHYWPTGAYRNSFTSWILTKEYLAGLLPPLDKKFVQLAAAAIYSNGHDTLTFLAELASVKNMFLSVGKKLLRLHSMDRTLRRKALTLKEVRDYASRRSVKDVSNEWLQARYGWRTLGYDLMSLNKAIQNLNVSKKRYSERKGNTTQQTSIETLETPSPPSVDVHSVNLTIVTGVRGSVVADIDVPQFQFNPLQTGWELIPYSFVIDWFVSVGKAISAASFLAYQSKYSASVGQYVKVTKSVVTTLRNNASVQGTRISTGDCEASLEVRTPCSVPLVPHFSLNLNAAKVADLVGLLVQRTK